MTHTSIAKIRQLCCLGIDSKQLVPRLLELLGSYIPAHGKVFASIDGGGSLTDFYDSRPEGYALLPTYLSEFADSREKEVFERYP